jgi:uncharacterized protein (DUF1330 family)
MEIFSKYSGKLLAVDEAPTVKEGDWPYTRTVLIEFPTAEAFDAWFNSQEYQALAKHRHAASPRERCYVDALRVHFLRAAESARPRPMPHAMMPSFTLSSEPRSFGMSVAFKIVDQTLGVHPHVTRELRLASERITLREPLERRIEEEEVAAINAGGREIQPLVVPDRQEARRHALVASSHLVREARAGNASCHQIQLER